jgi:hypothetical protein
MTYKVKFVSPSEKTPWMAVTHERNIDAECVNDLVDKALDSYDIKQGTRILEISAYNKEKGNWVKVL